MCFTCLKKNNSRLLERGQRNRLSTKVTYPFSTNPTIITSFVATWRPVLLYSKMPHLILAKLSFLFV